MKTSRNPAKSRPLSANVKRLMRLARASPQNSQVIKVARTFTARDYAYCHKQGSLFMEAASMGFSMEDFAPLYMTSQLAGVFDVSFAAANGMENDELSNLLRIPMLLKTPETIVEALYWIDDIIRARRKEVKVDSEWVLQEDVLCRSPSFAAMLVIGKHANGLTSWKTADGRTLKSMETT